MRARGNAIAEMPAGLWLLVVGFALPLLCLASMTIRTGFFYFAVRDTCYKAAKSTTFTNAKNNAATAWTTDINAWNGISGTQRTEIIVQPLAGGAQTISLNPLSNVNTQTNLYFIRVVGNGTIAPLIYMSAPPFGLNIPGLTVPFNLTVTDQKYAENPNGLTS